MSGWFKVPRHLLSHEIFRDAGDWRFLSWLLGRAGYEAQTIRFRSGREIVTVSVQPWEFITSWARAGKDLNLHPSKVRRLANRQSNLGFLTVKSTKRYSLFSLAKWAKREGLDKHPAKQATGQIPEKQQAVRHQTRIEEESSQREIIKEPLPSPSGVGDRPAHISTQLPENSGGGDSPWARLPLAAQERLETEGIIPADYNSHVNGQDPIRILASLLDVISRQKNGKKVNSIFGLAQKIYAADNGYAGPTEGAWAEAKSYFTPSRPGGSRTPRRLGDLAKQILERRRTLMANAFLPPPTGAVAMSTTPRPALAGGRTT